MAACNATSTSSDQPASLAGAPLAASSPDSLFQQPYIDLDEWRDKPVRHRYVHGGFKDTDTRFSFYFPVKEQYRRRFFQHITPAPDNENLAQRSWVGEEDKRGFAFASGAYFVETNGGGTGKTTDPQAGSSITAYRANAAAAQFSRVVAAKVYGPHRPYGYAYGGSGGGYRTIGSMENTTGVWDGAVPYVIGSTMAIPNVFSVRMHAMRILDRKFPQIIDAVEPGGSGNPYAGLNEEERAALREVTRMGFPLLSWFGYKTMGVHGFAAVYGGMVAADPSYFTDFWTMPGYLGATPPASLLRARVQQPATITGLVLRKEGQELGLVEAETNGGVDNAFKAGQDQEARKPVAFRLSRAANAPDFQGGDLLIKSGAAAGKSVPLSKLSGNVVVLGFADAAVVAQMAPGDTVVVDNSNFLAAQTYHRHQVPGPEFHVWDQFRGPNGQPIYPQRPQLLAPTFVKSAGGALQTGQFQGKMIVVASLWDREAFAWQADWYRGKVQEHLGAATADNFRLWYTDRALHGDEAKQEDPTRTVSYLGVLHQALRDVSAWVEKGVPPPASTGYTVQDGQVVVPPTAAARKGVQPVVTLQVNGGQVATVQAGTPVRFTAVAEVPPGTGKLVAAAWDLEGRGTYPVAGQLPQPAAGRAVLTTSYTFQKPGTYFPVIRVASQREADAQTPYARLQNIGRVRVVVR